MRTLTATARPGPPGTGGVWRMDGYGTVLVMGGGVLQEYRTASVGCLEG
ncbi:hypothetical protein ACIBJF_41330 [Streptomyces sp. NPDC050743]